MRATIHILLETVKRRREFWPFSWSASFRSSLHLRLKSPYVLEQLSLRKICDGYAAEEVDRLPVRLGFVIRHRRNNIDVREYCLRKYFEYENV